MYVEAPCITELQTLSACTEWIKNIYKATSNYYSPTEIQRTFNNSLTNNRFTAITEAKLC